MEKLGPGDPQQIGAYRLLARLGAGGMGDVYLARSDRGRTVAVKLVRRELAAQEEFRARFRQEVQAARQVGGFWTAPVLDADTEADVPWVATGYVAGPSLQQVVGQDHGALPERSVGILAAGLAHALKDIHAAGIVHRDLKPSNVLVTIDGPRVIDFGIARALETVDESGLTRTGALVGSPGFMAPEQVRGDRLTPACDVFCLGSVLAYAATGRLPFGSVDSGPHAVMFRIAQEEPDLEGMPEGIAELVRDCLRKDPGARPTLDRVLERTGAEDTVSDGRSRDPWLPSALVAQLGRHAVRLLDAENPVGATGTQPPGSPGSRPPAPAGDPAGASPPAFGAAGAGVPGPAFGAAGSGGRVPTAGPAGPDVPAPGAPASGEPTPAASPEHAPAAQPTPPDQLPTVAAARNGPTPPPGPGTPPGGAFGDAAAPGSAPAHPAYGSPQQHPQQHPQQPAYGYPQAGPGQPYGAAPGYGAYGPNPNYPNPNPAYAATPPYGPPGPYLPAPQPEPPRRSGRSTAALVVVALVVALGAGGSVYALMSGDNDDSAGGGPTERPTATSTSTDSPTSDPTTPTPSPTPSASADGTIPAGYLGTWTATIDSGTGENTRRLTIRQGEVGDTVLSLVADGPAGNGTYHCEFEADLSAAPGGDGPMRIGPSTVTVGEAPTCSPGKATEITLLPDGRLERVTVGSGESLTYDKQ
ncbi:serine/threonine-protein kinase [Streptomyces chartreusis]|uniref:serine/threonine-protein kinase n=1 Tax=Streptomyces chartreusis TaxID=1969 RepID=UPI002E824348|nr:protein kinase [Streptomyces chartreusis]WUB19611.1 protein kinase [Streptomyces chartreusis]